MSYKSYRSYIIALVLLVLPFIVGAYHTAGHDSIVTCGFNGPDCSLCSFLELAQSLLNFTLKIVVPSVAVILVIWAGYLYLTAGARPDSVKKAQATFKNIFIGLVIAVAAYSATSFLLGWLGKGSGTDFGFKGGVFTLDCTDTSPAIDISGFIKDGAVSFTLSEPEPKIKTADLQRAVVTVSGGRDYGVNLANRNVEMKGVKADIVRALADADRVLNDNGVSLVVTSAYRSLEKQKDLAAENCEDPDADKCSPLPDKALTCLPKGDGSNCPHTTGRAVDVWGVQNGKQCNKSSPCQNAVIQIMKSKGFCVLNTEPWHFELKSNPVSKGLVCSES